MNPGGQVNLPHGSRGVVVVIGMQAQLIGSSTNPGGQVNFAHGN